MVYCCVPKCRSERGRTKDVTFHEFPSHNAQRELWLKNISRKDWSPSERSVVCSLHFKKEDFRAGLKTKRLIEGAIPSVFEEFPVYMQNKSWKRKVPAAKNGITSTKAFIVENCDTNEILEVEIEEKCLANTSAGSVGPIIMDLKGKSINEMIAEIAPLPSLPCGSEPLSLREIYFELSKSPEDGWALYLTESDLQIFKLNNCVKTISVSINPEMEVTYQVFNYHLQSDHPLFQSVFVPAKIKNMNGVVRLLQELDTWSLCLGNNDKVFKEYPERTLKSGVYFVHTLSIHSKDCSYLVKGKRTSRCANCSDLRRRLNSVVSRMVQKTETSKGLSKSCHKM